jgi:hypothetical protein
MKTIISLVLAVTLLLAVAPTFIDPVWAQDPPGKPGGKPAEAAAPVADP